MFLLKNACIERVHTQAVVIGNQSNKANISADTSVSQLLLQTCQITSAYTRVTSRRQSQQQISDTTRLMVNLNPNQNPQPVRRCITPNPNPTGQVATGHTAICYLPADQRSQQHTGSYAATSRPGW